jgi:Dolichyl-phosphate-mannose-protein mannosyltransferase
MCTTHSVSTATRVTLALAVVLFIGHNVWILRSAPAMGGDSPRYIASAQRLLEEGVISGRDQNYSGFVLYLALMKTVAPGGDSFAKAAVAVQSAVALLALFCVYGIGATVLSERAGALASVFYALNPYAMIWNRYVLTDSLFISFVLISIWALVKASRRPGWLGLAVPVCVFTAMLRPNGVVYFPVFLVYLHSLLSKRLRVAACVVIAVAALAASPLLMKEFRKATDRIQAIDNLVDGVTVWREARIDMPKYEKPRTHPIADAVGYVTTYPYDALRLFAARLYAAYVFTRDDFSPRHNALLLVALPGLYALAAAGALRGCRRGITRDVLLMLGVLAVQTGLFAVTYSDHDPRFTCYTITLIALFAAYGFEGLVMSGGLSPIGRGRPAAPRPAARSSRR